MAVLLGFGPATPGVSSSPVGIPRVDPIDSTGIDEELKAFIPFPWTKLLNRIRESAVDPRSLAKLSTLRLLYHMEDTEACRLGPKCPIEDHFPSQQEARWLTGELQLAVDAFLTGERFTRFEYQRVIYNIKLAPITKGDVFSSLSSRQDLSIPEEMIEVLVDSKLVIREPTAPARSVHGEIAGESIHIMSAPLRLTERGEHVSRELSRGYHLCERRKRLLRHLDEYRQLLERADAIRVSFYDEATCGRSSSTLTKDFIGILPRLMDRDAPDSESVITLRSRFYFSKRRAQSILDALWATRLADLGTPHPTKANLRTYILQKDAFEVAGGMAMVLERIAHSPNRKIRELGR